MKETDLNEVKAFFEDRVLGWMLGDLQKSVNAGTNFLSALGCFTYTEIIGAFLPPLEKESGSQKEKRFYRCFFRLESEKELRLLDKFVRDETSPQQGLYQHLRHSASHAYYPTIKRRNDDGSYSFYPVAVSKTATRNGKIEGCPMMGINKDGYFCIATKNYVNELSNAYKDFFNKIFNEQDKIWVEYALRGMDFVARGKQG